MRREGRARRETVARPGPLGPQLRAIWVVEHPKCPTLPCSPVVAWRSADVPLYAVTPRFGGVTVMGKQGSGRNWWWGGPPQSPA